MDNKQGNPDHLDLQFGHLDFKEYWRILRTHRLAISFIFIIAILITLYTNFTDIPTYQATTVVMVKEDQNDPSSFVFDFGVNRSAQRLQNEIEILKSYNLNAQVVQSLMEDKSVGELALFGTRHVRVRYRLWDYFLERFDKPVKSDNKASKEWTPEQYINIVQNLRGSIGVSKVRDGDVLRISVNSSNGGEAVLLANRIAKVYRNLDLAGGLGEFDFMLTFLDSQISKHKQRLDIVEDKLQKFQSENSIYSLDGVAKLALEDLTKYESIYYTNMAEVEVAQNQIAYLRKQLSESERNLMEEITNTNNPMIVAFRSKISELEAQKIQQMIDEGWGEESLQARDFNRRISEMKEKLTSFTESIVLSGMSEADPFAASQNIFNKILEQEVEAHSAGSRAQEYKKLVDRMAGNLAKLPAQTLEYARLERELRLNENLYLTMKQKYAESSITAAGQRGKVRVLDPAIVAVKVKPNTRNNLFIGIILGLALGAGYAFLRELLDNTIKAVEHLEKKGITVLGIIPEMEVQKRKSSISGTEKSKSYFQRRLITYEDPKSPISESYRSLRTSISHSAGANINSLIISSPQPGEGKSTTTANLAIAFAQLRKRTLIIDADLRKPVQHEIFNQARNPGLSEYLTGEVEDIKFIIHETNIENLYIMSAGSLPPNPSELLGSQRMNDMVDNLEQEWDMILLDSPPIVAVTDASMISTAIDALALVVKAGETDRVAVDRALDTVKSVNANLIGAILNSVNPETLAGKYSYYSSYYRYHYYKEDDNTKIKQSKIRKAIKNLFS